MRKTGIFLLILLAIIVILCGCGKKPEESARFLEIDRATYYTVLVDTQTGVEYIKINGGGGVTPLIDSYGRPYIYPAFDAREDAL